MKARIYRPTRTAMQSGQANTHKWRLECLPEVAPSIDPLMGWTTMKDTTAQIKLFFDTEEEAIDYAKRNNLAFELVEPQISNAKPKSYSANFAANRVEA